MELWMIKIVGIELLMPDKFQFRGDNSANSVLNFIGGHRYNSEPRDECSPKGFP